MTETEPEYFLDNGRTRAFVREIRAITGDHERIDDRAAIGDLLAEMHEPFEELLLDDEWLPELYRDSPPSEYDDRGEMGRDIAQWLLYRSDDLVLFSLVVPPGVETPVHDHLEWGLVGLYQGRQRESFYDRLDGMDNDIGPAELALDRVQEQGRGDFYELIPPEDDIHKVETTSELPSVSIHLLGSDVGCIHRHAFDPEGGFVEQFVSHYTNLRCDTNGLVADGGHDHHRDRER